jgi:predicted nucleic-acid-binding protein
MIGLDTNVLVRYIMQDDVKQSPKATALIESLDSDHPGFITLVFVVELYWVLTKCCAPCGFLMWARRIPRTA